MNKKHTDIKDYILTFLIATFVVITFCLCVELNLLFASEDKVNQEELNMANLAKFCTIGELEKRREKEPSGYLVDIKLAQIYESLQKYDKADEYYNSALKKSQRSDYSLYSYAIFCADRSLYGLSATLAEELSSVNKNHNLYKAKIYERLGDNLTINNQILAATKAFQVAYKYANAINDNDYYILIKQKFAYSNINAADYYISKNDPKEAISYLKNSIKIYDTLIARYKLGLIYIEIDKVQADRYISYVFNKNPYIVNPYIYNQLLNDLINISKIENKPGSLNYYSVKLSRFKKQLLQYYIYKGDILINNIQIKNTKKLFDKKNSYNLVYDIRNNTKNVIRSLYIKTEIVINSNTYTLEKKVITYPSEISYYDIAKDITMKLPSDINFINILSENDAIIKFYAKKKEQAPWVLVKIEQLNF